MTYQQSMDLAELEADTASECFIDAPEADEHLELLDHLNIEAPLGLPEMRGRRSVSIGHFGCAYGPGFAAQGCQDPYRNPVTFSEADPGGVF